MRKTLRKWGRRIQAIIDKLRGKERPEPTLPPVEDIHPPEVPETEPTPEPGPEPVAPPYPWFRWVPVPGKHIEVYIPTVYRVWRLGIWTASGHQHVHPYNYPTTPESRPWYWDDTGTPQGDGSTLYIVPVPPEELQRRALSHGRGDRLLVQGNAAGRVEDGTRAASWFVRALVGVTDGPNAGIRNR